ncbi:MAG: type II secretion system F family protein [Patescibacteria group bacterium]
MANKFFNKINKISLSLQTIPAPAKIFLLQNLSVMIKAGVSLSDALKALADQGKNPKLQHILNEACEKVREGKTLSESFLPYQKDFGEMFINMLSAGEASGRLEDVLNELYLQIKKDHTLKMKIKNAMTYPVIILFVMIGIAIFVVLFILPNMTKMFSELNAKLPWSTVMMMNLSDFMQKNGLWVLVGVIILIAAFIKGVKTKAGKHLVDIMILRLPIVAPIIKKINLARISQSLSSLIKTDISIVDSLKITSKIVNNTVYRQALEESSEKVKKGEKIANIFKGYPQIFQPIVIQMIMVGEETGKLDEVMQNLASFYDEEVTQTMNTLPTIIEPVLMICIGIGVAGIAVAVLMPMYSLTSAM